MKFTALTLILSFFFISGIFAQDEVNQEQQTIDYKKTARTDHLVKFVISVPESAENLEQYEKMKNYIDPNLVIKREDGMIVMVYSGVELTSAIEPDFVSSVNVLKGEKAKSKYADAPEGGVVEITVANSDDLMKVYNSVRTQ